MNITLALKHQQLDEHNAAQMRRIEQETSTTLTITVARGATPGGDEDRLRGIPAIGRIRGAIKGTIPHVDGTRAA